MGHSRSRSRSPTRRPSYGRYQKETKNLERKVRPNYNASGKLSEGKLRRGDVLLKYDEPAEACKPNGRWRLHIFKGDNEIGIIKLHDKSCFRIGREPSVSDILIEHESCSKQHAVIQHRQVSVDVGFGVFTTYNKPYIIDLESTHGTILNGKRIEPGRFIELKPNDIIKFAYSTREYVVLEEE